MYMHIHMHMHMHMHIYRIWQFEHTKPTSDVATPVVKDQGNLHLASFAVTSSLRDSPLFVAGKESTDKLQRKRKQARYNKKCVVLRVLSSLVLGCVGIDVRLCIYVCVHVCFSQGKAPNRKAPNRTLAKATPAKVKPAKAKPTKRKPPLLESKAPKKKKTSSDPMIRQAMQVTPSQP